MTSVVTAQKPQKERDRISVRKDNFWNQTVGENNARLDGKNIPSDALKEIKFIQSVLLANGRPNEQEVIHENNRR